MRAVERSEQSENPYKPPATVPQRRGGFVRSFQVGMDEINTVIVESSLWTGLKTHSRDAAGIVGPVHRGPCEFEVGNRERHQVMIKVDGRARVNAYVDGELVEANLMGRQRAVMFFVALVLAFVGIILFLFGFLGFDKYVDQWFESQM